MTVQEVNDAVAVSPASATPPPRVFGSSLQHHSAIPGPDPDKIEARPTQASEDGLGSGVVID
jgi:hypothetical protein